MDRIKLVVGGVFLPIGLGLLAGASWMFNDDRNFAHAAIAGNGTVVELVYSTDSDGDTTSRPVVDFTDRDGKSHRFTGKVGSNPPSFHEGERVAVLYNASSPGDARSDNFWDRHFGTALLGFMGTAFTLAGAGTLISLIRRRRVVADLQTSGQTLSAKFLETFVDTSTSVNGRHPYRVACQAVHPATGKLTRFDSERIWVDPTELIGKQPIRVLVDFRKPKQYFVDIAKWVDSDG